MSKQSEAKARQFYTPKLTPMVCSNCKHYQSDKSTREGMFGGVYIDESNKRCGLGGFAVAKTGSCTEHVYLAP